MARSHERAFTPYKPAALMALAVLTLMTTLAFVAGPFLVPNFGGFDPDLFAVPQRDPPVQPAGWAFAIWGPIYLWLLGSALFGAFQRRDDSAWARARPALIVSLGVGAAWLPVAQTAPLYAAIMIWVMLAAALAALLRSPAEDRFALRWPLGLYAGWLSAAACVALGLNLAGAGLLSGPVTALAMIAFATVLAALVQSRVPDVPVYGAAVTWALLAIFASNRGADPVVAWASLGGAALMAALTIRAMRRAFAQT